MTRSFTFKNRAILAIALCCTLLLTCSKSTGPENKPPAVPKINNSSGCPDDNSKDASITPVISWSCSDPDGDPLKYDVHFGSTSTPDLVSRDQKNTMYTPDTLKFSTTYYWRIVAKDDHGHSTSSPKWKFTTRDAPPSCSVVPSSLPFDTVTVGDHKDLTFTITNTGGGTLSGSVSEACNHYSIVSGGGSYSLGSGQSRTVTVRFSPASSGYKSCTIETGDPLCSNVSCTGNGEPPPCNITVTNPSSGDNWQEGSNQTIQWDYSGGGNYVKAQLYKGFTYLCPITSSTSNDGSYSWTVDDCGGGTSSNYRIKIINTSDPDCYDYSDYFTITASTVPCNITVTNPSSGDNWQEGSNQTVQWDYSGGGNYVKIDLYKGSSYLCEIASSTLNDGSYSWIVDDCGGGAGSDYRIKITDLSNHNCYDISGSFAINFPSCRIVVNSPQWWKNWYEGSSGTIEWGYSGGSNLVRIDLYKDSLYLCCIASSTLNDGSYTTTVDDCGGGTASDYMIKVTDLSDTNCYDFSQQFTINVTAPCSIAVTSPSYGDTFPYPTAEYFEWDYSGGGNNVWIELYKGYSFLCTLDYAANDGECIWFGNHCGGGTASNYRIKITNSDDTNCYDFSDDFTIIVPCDILVSSTFYNDNWQEGSIQTIPWDAIEAGNSVKIELYKDTTSYLCEIASSTPNDGSYSWIVDDCGGGTASNYHIKVTSISDPDCYDYSLRFTITASDVPCSITVTNPSSGYNWQEGSNQTVQWDHSGGGNYVKAELYKGSSYLCTINSSTSNDGSYSWVVDDCGGGTSSNYRIKITNTSESSCYDYSDYFTITASEVPCSITVTNPSSGDNWQEGSDQTIQWNYSGGGGLVKIELTKGGAFLCTISSSTSNDGSYPWTVNDCGGGTASNYRILITNLSDGSCNDPSDNFTITASEVPCNITVTSPASDVIWTCTTDRWIKWNSSGAGDFVKIELYKGSYPQGPIESSTANDGEHYWTVSDWGGGAGSDYEIKITSTIDTECYAFSDEFCIAGFMDVTNPSSGDNLEEGTNCTIEWDHYCGGDSVKLELYKGSSYQCTISPSTSNDGSYSWTVNDCGGGTASNYSIKITNLSHPNPYYFSDDFSIDAGPWIKSFYATEDAFVSERAPNSNFGDDIYLVVGRDNDGSDFESIINFDTFYSEIPDNAVIEKAELTIYRKEFEGYVEMWVWLASRNWSEYTVTWNYQRPGGVLYQTTIVATSPGSIKNVDVTDHVRAWVNGDWGFYGFFLGYKSTPSPGHSVVFYSREYQGSTNKKPELRVKYHLD